MMATPITPTVMSTVDGYTFIGGVNFGRDLVWRMSKKWTSRG